MEITQNWMLDETKKLLSHATDRCKLIDELTIRKIEYGRLCMRQLFCSFTLTESDKLKWKELDDELSYRIKEIKDNPTKGE